MTQNKIFIYGKHALMEALESVPKAVKKVYLAPQVDDAKLRELIKNSGVALDVLKGGKVSGDFNDIASSTAHQGVIAQISLSDLVQPFDKFVQDLKVTPGTALILLDELQDPHNVGAVIRSAAAFGVAGVLIPEHNQAPVTGAVVKVSAGMAFRIPLVQIGNINHTIRELKDKGFWVYGLAGEGATPVNNEKFDAPALFILGNESVGIRLKTRELCDKLISIPMSPRCESLNAAASAAVALYAWSTQHPEAL